MEWVIAGIVVLVIVGVLLKFAYDHKREEEHLAELSSLVEKKKTSE